MIYNRLPSSGFTLVANALLRDPGLSWKAKALHAYIASHDETYPLTVEQVVAQGAEGEKSVQAGLRELEAASHLARVRRRGDRGRWIYDWHLVQPDRTPQTGTRSDQGKRKDPQLPPCSPDGAAVTRPLEDHPEHQLEDHPSGGSSFAPPGHDARPDDDEEHAMTSAAVDQDQLGLDFDMPEPEAPKPKPRRDGGPCGRVVAAYCRSYVDAHQAQPASERGRVAGQVKALLAQGHTEEELIQAAEALGRTRFTYLAEELRRVRDEASRHQVEGWGKVDTTPAPAGYVEGW